MWVADSPGAGAFRVVVLVQYDALARANVAHHDGPGEFVAVERFAIRRRVRHIKPSVRAERGMVPRVDPVIGDFRRLARIAVDDPATHIDDGAGIRVPGRVAPFFGHGEKRRILQIVAEQPETHAGVRTAEIAARRCSHLEKDPAEIGAQDREEHRNRFLVEVLLHPVGIRFLNGLRRQRGGLDLPRLDVE